MGKNNNKPVRAPPPTTTTEADFEEKPFHSKEYEKEYLDGLLNAKERPTWDEFKELQRKKNEMDGDGVQEAAQRKFRQQLDEERAARLAERGGGQADEKKKEKKSRKEKKHKSKKEKKEKHKKEKHKKRRNGSQLSARQESSSEGSGDSSEDDEREKKRKKAEGPVSLRSFFAAGSSDDD
ncbi:hypothetical protein AB1Y20_009542 [Prymnesium parvum]|uniref:Uncharacterized protein n=1 Tax=Prymnesium parvum TaxID=97485 RepID=A0AB34K4V2_PRYPA